MTDGVKVGGSFASHLIRVTDTWPGRPVGEIMVSTSLRILPGLALVALAAGTAGAGFTIRDLGPAPGASGTAGEAINALGQVAGRSTLNGSPVSAIRTSGQGGFAAVTLPSYAGAAAGFGINSQGDVAGQFVDKRDGLIHGFVTSAGGASELGPLSVAGIKGGSTRAGGINDAGEVVGTGSIAGRMVDGVFRSGTTQTAFRAVSSGAATIINPLGNGLYNMGSGINAAGTVVGTSETAPGGFLHAFLATRGGAASDLLSRNSAGIFGLNTYGAAINDRGDVAGSGDVGGFRHAFLASHEGGALQDLGVIGNANSSIARGLNSLSHVVGELDDPAGRSHAFLYDPRGGLGMIDLNTLLAPSDQSDWTLISAAAINDNDQITGVGIHDGLLRGFLLTPAADPSVVDVVGPALVPAPPASVLAAIGLGIVAAGARLRRGRTGVRGAA